MSEQYVDYPGWWSKPERFERGLEVFGDFSPKEARAILRAAEARTCDTELQIKHLGKWLTVAVGDGSGECCCPLQIKRSNPDPIKSACRFPMWGAMVDGDYFVMINAATDG